VVVDPFGKYKIIIGKKTNLYFTIFERKIKEKPEFDLALRVATEQKSNQSRFFVNLVNFSVSKPHAFRNSYLIQYLYEFSFNSLFREIETYGLQGFDASYGLPRIYEILGSIAEGLASQKQAKAGDIRPATIFVFPNNSVKIYDNIVFPPSSAYAQIFAGSRKDPNLSPQLYDQLRRKDANPKIDAEKENVFALGLLGLKVALLRNELNLYDAQKFIFKKEVLAASLENV